jgi:hypothetical protein
MEMIGQVMPDFPGYLQSCLHDIVAELIGSASNMPQWAECTVVPPVSSLAVLIGSDSVMW